MTTDNPQPTAPPTRPQYAAFIGIDWASQEHAVCLQEANGQRFERRTLKHSPVQLQEWVAQLRERFSGRPVAVAVELARGPLVYALMGYEFIHLYPINPKSLARFRESFRPSGAKDDDHDGEMLCRLLSSRLDQLTVWKPEDPDTRALAHFTEIRRHWVDQATALVLRWRTQLQAYYPVFLELFDGQLDNPMACQFLQRWPNLAALKKARQDTLRGFFYKHGSRSESKIQQRLKLIGEAQPLTEDLGVIAPSQADALIISRLMLTLIGQIAELQQEITRRFALHPDAFIFKSLPGAGPVLAPRLLAAFGTQRSKFQKPEGVQKLSGMAPVTVSSGKSKIVHYRWAAPNFLRQTFWEFAKCSLKTCPWAQEVVDRLMAKGKGFNMAVRTLAFKWIRVVWRMWQNRETYDEARYLDALRRKGSPHLPTASAGQTPC